MGKHNDSSSTKARINALITRSNIDINCPIHYPLFLPIGTKKAHTPHVRPPAHCVFIAGCHLEIRDFGGDLCAFGLICLIIFKKIRSFDNISGRVWS